MLSHRQLRDLFGNFWLSKNHREIPPISLVPKDDPTTLFTGSGMQQLVPYLLGEIHPQGKRLYNIQPCFRSQDIEEVGDNRHDTFFEMMGNWSLGDYFKKEQLAWFFEFLITVLQLPKEKLYVTVFAGTKEIPADTDSYKIWKDLKISKDHIYKYEGNWWSRAGNPDSMPPGEPGGPDSEVFFEFTEVEHNPKYGKTCHPNCDCGRFLEIGNCVFMQYQKTPSGAFAELPKKNVDFGGGLERLLAAANNNPDIFMTDLYLPIISAFENEFDIKYDTQKNKTVLRIIADHSKAASLIIKDGVFPGNKEQGYYLRRLIRRMVVKTRILKGMQVSTNYFEKAIDSVLEIYDKIYFDKTKDRKKIQEVIGDEISKFSKTLEKGLKEINHIKKIDGKIAFNLYQSYGIPVEITEEIYRQKGQEINKKQFRDEFDKHRDISRTSSAGKFKGGLADQNSQTLKFHTATHLLHQALFDVVGNEVRQEGSNITGERLRFDFYSVRKPTEEEIKKISKIVNEKIQMSLPVYFKILPKEEALKLRAKSFFREKYPDMVKVFFIADYSKEFCGGPHVSNTKDIGKISIYKFEKIGNNLYRIYAK